ncbi:30S ribosome-binding factor RbfA [Proteobacteria bacterium 005FR1]|nr:30S ribosome-binding factor RbfA [Proteobacteria bacterium 005FR1]
MPKEFSRQIRVADQIQRSLAQMIQSEINDPRLGLVNINEVDVSRDYANARVYVTFVGDETQTDVEQSIAILNKASGFLRSLLAKSLNSRSTPRLRFVYDKTSVEGQRLNHLINQAVSKDRRES